MTSNEYLYRCLDTMEADADISETTKILMFKEYARLVVLEQKDIKKAIREGIKKSCDGTFTDNINRWNFTERPINVEKNIINQLINNYGK